MLTANDRVPEIFNTDQVYQFTSAEWIGCLLGLGVMISTDSPERWRSNVFIERLWRIIKYGGIYWFGHATVTALWAGVKKWLIRYND